MGKNVDLLRGTLEMLVLKAVSLGPQHGYGVLLRIQQLAKGSLSNRARSIRRCIGWSAKDSSNRSGAKATTIARRSSIG